MAEKIADISLNTISWIKLNDKDERIIERIKRESFEFMG